jgi:OOP family OmpA-OmpF porin
MLSAIDSFGREALGPMSPESHLEKFEFGELVVWVDRGPSLTLTAVIRGSATADLGRQLTETRERITLAIASELEQFSGDVTPFMATRQELESLLITERKTAPRRAHIWLAVAAALLVVAIVGFTWRAHVRGVADARARGDMIGALTSEPGIVVTSAEWSGGRGRVSGLRDPIAPAPDGILARHGLSRAETHFAPFVSLDPRVVSARAQRALAPPPTASLALADGTLRVAGVAPSAWIDEARLLGRSLPGIERYDDHALRSSEALQALERAASSLDAIVIPFDMGRARIGPAGEARVRRAADLANEALQRAAQARVGACIELTGHADSRGNDQLNRSLSEARASAVARRFAELGVDAARIRVRGGGAWDEVGARARSVLVRLDTGDEPGCGAER